MKNEEQVLLLIVIACSLVCVGLMFPLIHDSPTLTSEQARMRNFIVSSPLLVGILLTYLSWRQPK